jgi:hypothetical protein
MEIIIIIFFLKGLECHVITSDIQTTLSLKHRTLKKYKHFKLKVNAAVHVIMIPTTDYKCPLPVYSSP